MSEVLLSTTYFGPIEWYQHLYRSDRVYIEACESFIKQTYRNRCVIATANGPQALTVPVEHNSKLSTLQSSLIKDLRISNHGSWRRVHWNALQSAYSESPFFDYYADDLRPFFERDYTFLYDFNFEITQKMCELLDIHPHIEATTEWVSPDIIKDLIDLRYTITPKKTLNSPLTESLSPLGEGLEVRLHDSLPYWQVFDRKHGFLPNLSILDLLFCKGPEAIFWL